ncbi:hypothetical protein GCM10010435_88020 [Winogradskya consettensis]|uniref:Uncharacterized protein n=1 Tax=Winogradskya consettensis TaxID=113560 RepID=A0A919VVU7_9ACTN|nr:hypothetical protein [Actinoplanes consettensis]GIM80994.1 hypothetical protein Aco04nite_74300 [Actinoplanes consettensis]
MIVVQRVLTVWTKRSRGAPGAVPRNAVPESFDLPPGVPVHEITAREDDNFSTRQTLNPAACVRAEVVDGHLAVSGITDVWCQCFSVFPRRPDKVKLRLERGQWGRWRVNFRYWEDFGTSEWRYEKWSVNVAYLPGLPPADLFRSTTPDVVTDELVKLW